MDKDIGNYLDGIEFETEVYPGVYWVPLNRLGRTRYRNEEMKQVADLPIEERRGKIQNLYEAVQLFQCAEFKGVIDNVKRRTNRKELWELHKNRENAVRSNEGCCASDTNWLSYFLEGKYDALGAFCYVHEDMNGHITTYIKQDDDYYFIDMMMCRKDSQEYFKKEDGNPSGIENALWSGYLYRCKNPYDYCMFTIEKLKEANRAVPYCFYLRETVCVEATGVRIRKNGFTLLLPENENPKVLYLKEDSPCDATIVPTPGKIKNNISVVPQIFYECYIWLRNCYKCMVACLKHGCYSLGIINEGDTGK